MGEGLEKGFFINPIEQWSQLLGGCNWYTFHPIKIEIEDDRIMGAVECTIILMGLGITARWHFRDTEATLDLAAKIEELEPRSPAPQVKEE